MTDSAIEAPRVAPWAKWMYGLGAVAFGVKDNGFSYFLLFYYSQVLGLKASLAGTAILVAMVFDAVADPIVGYVSDNTHTRWGRRHPFMYAAAVPVAVLYYFLWSPPAGLSQFGLFIYLMLMAVLIRQCITLYETPSTSIVAELTERYDERTELLGYRYMFGWWGGLGVVTLAWFVFLADTPAHPHGALNPDGYHWYGLTGSIMIFVSIMASSLALHRYIPHLKSPPPKQRFRLGTIVTQIGVTLSNRNFLALFVAGLFASIGAGISTNFNGYISNYFWGLTSSQIRWINLSLFAAAALANFLAPVVTKRWDKKRSALGIYAVSIVWGATPVVLRLLDWFPANGSPLLLPVLIAHSITEVTMIVMFGIIQSSMLADIVENSELKTSRREEGLFFAARTFAAKATSGVGAFIAGIAISMIQFPVGAAPETVAPDKLFSLGVIYGPILMVFYGVALYCMTYYKITRSDHDAHVEVLKLRADSTAVGPAVIAATR